MSPNLTFTSEKLFQISCDFMMGTVCLDFIFLSDVECRYTIWIAALILA